MTDRFQNKYRIPSTRAQWHDYSACGIYFITICTAAKECLFGNITNGVMNYSPLGEMVFSEWEKSFIIRAELFCDAFVIMPNHIHAILRIENIQNNNIAGLHETTGAHVETHGRASLQPTQSIQQSQPTPQSNTGIAYRPPKSISSFVAGFKSAATKRINEYKNTPKQAVWQERFHDHVIRNDAEYQRISDYIINNPANWKDDKFYSA